MAHQEHDEILEELGFDPADFQTHDMDETDQDVNEESKTKEMTLQP